MSRIGKKPIVIPQGVKVESRDGVVFVEGPKGKLSRALTYRVSLEVKDNQVFVSRVADTKLDRCQHGLYRALISNMIQGVTEGYVKQMEIIGVGFKAQVQGKVLNMNLGFSHPINISIPEGIIIETPKQTQIIVRGMDKEKVGEVSAKIRAVYPPEPYKGKGIRFVGEHVKKKAGKSQGAAK
ncbi:MAG: 50S ribosomal protein L6 [Candidatus Omnitrophota bacterium]